LELFVGQWQELGGQMQPLFSTSEVHPRDRFDYWHDVACKKVVHHDAEPDSRQTFRGELRYGLLGSIGLVTFENSPMSVTHTPRHVSLANPDEVFILRQETGLLTLGQASREVKLGEGDIALLDPRLPYTARYLGDSHTLLASLPRRALEARIGATRDLTAARIAEPEGGLLSSVLAMLPFHSERLSTTVSAVFAENVLDLVAVSVARMAAGRRPKISSARSVALMNIRVAIETRLTDPSLDAEAVASAAGLGVRYANAVLVNEGTSIMRLVLARRLERCRKAFDDPSQFHRKISEIAYGWGFSDMTHFGRKFRAAYGCLPGDYRKRMRDK
jgi:AraC family transcriptional regulator, positive regulator of tynA and feaB